MYVIWNIHRSQEITKVLSKREDRRKFYKGLKENKKSGKITNYPTFDRLHM